MAKVRTREDILELLQKNHPKDYSIKEIAEILNISQSLAKKLYYKGLKALKNNMQNQEERDKKRYAVVILGLQGLGQDSTFIPSEAFVSSTIAGISSSLGKIFLQLTGKKMITLFGKAITTKSLIVAGISTVVGISTIGTGAYLGLKNDNPEQEENIDSLVNRIPMQ